ncbi:hypothetical protein WICANDRAFT_35226 [Wickerhamomyces anomalus NRRL Y-366-8]|uniref:High osmolarity signaling protein SHO1 n=1 Tax=Wickerhamomyces anomalus (strain ATCC 58044 / CBS 1984 / NCYC 433 / NRRL Y-366-8) TaxID=683960 RepID=A0A1E3NX08_WICAA|nr:uncharacterized protein WICANDRAFT_35226 [Wickerhamomyces anomalus NRRL Y-366-8]ODQ57625.1 hypothetical protein WICANDRAFT_35226 [Wickerhamomyces anomalus NRRL Y-366-8]
MGAFQKPQSSRSNFQFSNISTDPFAISTISIALISWIIAFGGAIAASLVKDPNNSFPNFSWWGIVFELVLLIMLFCFYTFDLIDQYKIFLTSAFGIAFVYTTNSATSLVYSSGSGKAAASAGVILLSMVNLIWVFYYGGDNTSPVNQWIDSFSLRGPRSSNNPFAHHNQLHGNYNGFGVSNNNVDDYRGSTVSNQRFVSSTRLNGLENLSERNTDTNNTPMYENIIPENHDDNNDNINTNISNEQFDTNLMIDDFPYTARALYSYESSPEDENEISFEKGEILKVNDIHSRWWQAKRSNGEIGICPSNYVELIE